MNTKKILALGAATLCAAAIAVSGTYAWVSGTQSAVNEFENKTDVPPTDYNVLLHDDFKAPNKDVYVENTGKAPIYVRIKLSELYQTYADKAHSVANFTNPTTGVRGDSSTFEVHDYTLDDTTPENCDNGFHDKFVWKMGGAATAYAPNVGDSYKAGTTDAQKTETTPESTVMTAKAYNALVTKPDNVWVLGEDGYAYWSEAVAPGKATGLLLDSVTVDPSLANTNYYYAINVGLEAVDYKDLNAWLTGNGTGKDKDGNDVAVTVDKVPDGTEIKNFVEDLAGSEAASGAKIIGGKRYIKTNYDNVAPEEPDGIDVPKAVYVEVDGENKPLANPTYIFDKLGEVYKLANDTPTAAADVYFQDVAYYGFDNIIYLPARPGTVFTTITTPFYVEVLDAAGEGTNIYIPITNDNTYRKDIAVLAGDNFAPGGTGADQDTIASIDVDTYNTWLNYGK